MFLVCLKFTILDECFFYHTGGRMIKKSWFGNTHGYALGGRHLDHGAQELLTLRGHEVGNVEHAALHLLQELPEVVVVER